MLYNLNKILVIAVTTLSGLVLGLKVGLLRVATALVYSYKHDSGTYPSARFHNTNFELNENKNLESPIPPLHEQSPNK